MNRLSFIILCIFFTYLSSCKQDRPLPKPIPNKNVFIDPKPGHKSLFIRFKGDIGRPFYEIDNFQYIPDTLEVEVMGTTTLGYLMEERYTKGSQIMQEIRDRGRSDSVFTYQLIQKPDGWDVLPNPDSTGGRSKLLHPEIPVSKGVDPTNGQKLTLTIGNHVYDELTLAFDYSPMAYDGPGYHLFYSMEHGLIRRVGLGSWIPKSSGWDYLNEETVE